MSCCRNNHEGLACNCNRAADEPQTPREAFSASTNKIHRPEEVKPSPKSEHKLVIHDMNYSSQTARCGVSYMDLRFDEGYQAWCKTLTPGSLDVPRCLECIKLELTEVQEKFAHQKKLQGVESPLGGLVDRPAEQRNEPLPLLDEDLLCPDA